MTGMPVFSCFTIELILDVGDEMIEIDGSYGEGGGAILRVATALAAFTGRSVHIGNIRANRPQKGLMAQHLHAVKAVSQLSQARVEGLEIGSEKIKFHPQKLTGKDITVDIKTAGSISLVLQAVMILAVGVDKPFQVTVRGGTDVRWSPLLDYLKNVTLPILGLMGYQAHLELKRRGYYPRGGGLVNLEINPPFPLQGLKLKKLQVKHIRGVSHATRLPEHVAQRQADKAREILTQRGYDVDIQVEVNQDALGSGSGIVLWTEGQGRVGGSGLGERGKRAEKVGQEAAQELLFHLEKGAPLDRYLSDQIIPYLALAGDSRVKVAQITPHTLTNIHVAEKITGVRFQVEDELITVD
ncbi:MAG: RNA 3'-terminal phosphate cyclase [Methanobacteriaceae archaeon]